MDAPAPTSVGRVQDSNVTQIFQSSVKVSYRKNNTLNTLSGVNLANVSNEISSELLQQITHLITIEKQKLNFTLINGAHQYIKGSDTVAARSRGLIPAIQTNRFSMPGGTATKGVINNLLTESIKNGIQVTSLEIWVHPAMMDKLTDIFVQIPGSNLPASRTEGGVAYDTLYTTYGRMNVMWDLMIPDDVIMFVNIGNIAIAENRNVPLASMTEGNDEAIGYGMFYEPLAKTGAANAGQIYGEMGIDYSAENLHALLDLR
jgi:hypothetical protein